jgi:hypothetical protein
MAKKDAENLLWRTHKLEVATTTSPNVHLRHFIALAGESLT